MVALQPPATDHRDMVAEHTCMRVRGVKDACAATRARAVVGAFKTDGDLRKQALAMLD